MYAPCDKGWRRLIGCLKLQVIIRKRATDYRALLQKMTHKDKASYDSTPPCTCIRVTTCKFYMYTCKFRSDLNLNYMYIHVGLQENMLVHTRE